MMTTFVLYALLGMLLTVAGVGIMDRPIMFLAILGTVLAIYILGHAV
jgi:hypothetical protein